MRDAGAGRRDAHPAAVLEAGIGAGGDRDLPVDHAGIERQRARRARCGLDREAARRRGDRAVVQERAETAAHQHAARAGAACADRAVVGGDTVGVDIEADAARARRGHRAVVHDVVALDAGDQHGARRAARQRAVVGDRVVDAGHGGGEGVSHAVQGVDADRGAAVDRIGRGRAAAVAGQHAELGPRRVAVRVDMHDPGMGAGGVDRIGHQVVGVGAAAAGDALEMRHHRAGAGRVVVGVDAGRLVEDVGARQARPEARTAGDVVAIDAVGGRAGVGARPVDGRHRPGRDVVEEGIAHVGVAEVPVADHLVAEVRMGDGVEGARAADQCRELLAGRIGAVEQVAEVAVAVGRGLVAADDAQDAGGRAEARPVGRVGGGAGEVDGWRRGVGVGRRGERRQGVEHAGGAAAGTGGKVAGHAVAANAGDRGDQAAGVAEGRVVERLCQRRRRRQASGGQQTSDTHVDLFPHCALTPFVAAVAARPCLLVIQCAA